MPLFGYPLSIHALSNFSQEIVIRGAKRLIDDVVRFRQQLHSTLAHNLIQRVFVIYMMRERKGRGSAAGVKESQNAG